MTANLKNITTTGSPQEKFHTCCRMEKMIDPDELERHVTVVDGVIRVESVFKAQMPYDDYRLLMSCVEDNAGDNDIDYIATIRDYEEALKMRLRKAGKP